MPTQHDIQKIRNLLLEAFHLLCINDTDLIDLGDSEVLEYSIDSGKLERKLHEVCINHRLAHYIEELLPKYYPNVYKVDIEYNRYYKNKKYVDVEGEKKTVRPDIIVHTRAKQTEYPQHLLVIEAKKDIDCPFLKKVRAIWINYIYSDYKMPKVVTVMRLLKEDK